MTCEPGCSELEEFMLPASTVSSITLRVEEMCQPGVAGVDEIKIIGGFVERGKHKKQVDTYPNKKENFLGHY